MSQGAQSAAKSDDGPIPVRAARLGEGPRALLESIARGDPLPRTLDLLMRLVESDEDGLLSSVLLLEGGHLRHGAAPSLPAAYCQAIDGLRIGPGVGSCGTAAFTGEPVFVEDVLEHPYWAPFRDLAAEHGLRACWSSPIRARDGAILGTFAIYYRQPRLPTEAERLTIADATHLAGLAIEQSRLQQIADERRARERHVAQLREFFAQAPIPVAVLLGPELRYEIANDAYEKLVNRRDLQGRTVADVFPELEGQGILQLLRGVYETGQPYRNPELGVELDRAGTGVRESVHFSVVIEPFREGERVVGLIAVALEVSDQVRNREQIEALLRQTQEQTRALSTLQSISRTIASHLDTEQLVQNVTDAATQVSGAAFGAFFYNQLNERGETYTLYAVSGVPRAAFSKFPNPRATALFGPTFRGDGVIRSGDITKDPRYGKSAPHHGMPPGHLPVRSYLAVPVISRSGKVHGGLFMGHPAANVFTGEAEHMVVGIAAQAAIALDNAELYANALESERRFRTMAETLPQAVWFTSAQGALEWTNQRWLEYTGQAREESVGEGWLAAIHPEDAPDARAAWARALRDGSAYDVRYRIRRQDGEYRWHIGRAVPLRNDSGDILRWFGSCTDVHDERTRQEEVDKMRGEISRTEKMAALGQLVSGVAHEIRTPLTYLMTNLNVIQLRLERHVRSLPPEQAEASRMMTEQFIPSAIEAVDRINHLVEDLRAYTQLRHGERTAERLDAVVSEAIRLFQATQRGRIRVAMDGAEMPEIPMDKLQVQQAVLNLLQNAAEAEPRDHTIRVRVEATAAGARLTVEDTGKGIPADVQARLFDPFFTTKAGGTGLGLSIVQRIVQDHGGRVRFRTGPDGTAFLVDLPRGAPESIP